MARILVVGVMRAGKSTVAEALGRLDGVEVVEEPDNPLSRPFAFRVKWRGRLLIFSRHGKSLTTKAPRNEVENIQH